MEEEFKYSFLHLGENRVCSYITNFSRTDPVRPFISGHVANSMAAEVIALLHSLLTAPENLAAQTWAAAVERVGI